MATTSIQVSEERTRRTVRAPAVREAVEQRVPVLRAHVAGKPTLWHSAFADPEPNSPWRLVVNFNYGAPGMQLDPGDGNPPVTFTGPSMRYAYAMPIDPPWQMIVAKLLAADGGELDELVFLIPRLEHSPPSVPALWVRRDDWPEAPRRGQPTP
jgi:hypothetical protein